MGTRSMKPTNMVLVIVGIAALVAVGILTS
jgi:hypothetical protein